MNNFIARRIKSIGIAFRGARLLIATEASIKVQLAIAIFITLAGIYVNLSPTEWMLQTLAIAIVIGMEGINTALEKTADFIHPDHNDKIGFIKDIAAGAVFISALAATAVGCIIYVPRLGLL
ncbi:MAG: diacylglycerol kinase family protein [Sinomicrobium sp.]|nr:diacylglycerol kinase family protein [Sinomicrobium sp.]